VAGPGDEEDQVTGGDLIQRVVASVVPTDDHCHLALPPEHAQRPGIERKERGVLRCQPQPPGTYDPQEVTVGERQDVTGHRPRERHHPIRPLGHLGQGLAVDHAVAPEEPAGPICAYLGTGPSLVRSVVPLQEVLADLCRPREPCESAGLPGPRCDSRSAAS